MSRSTTAVAPRRSALSRALVGLTAVAALTVTGVGGLAAVATPALAASDGTGAARLAVDESFSGSKTSDSAWRFLGDGCLTAAPAAGTTTAPGVCARRVGSPVAGEGRGHLQLTDATGWRKGGAVYQQAIPSSSGIDVSFDQLQFGSNAYGGDGLVFFVADGAADITSPGGLGGSLGYAQNTNQPAAPNGLAGAYLGVGLDAHGVFSTAQDGHGKGCTSPQSATLQPNSVVLRGPGSGTSGYCLLTSSKLDPTTYKLRHTVADTSVVNASLARRFRVTVSADALPTVRVYAAPNPGADARQVLQYTMTTPPPASYQFGFVASSGSVSDTHLVSNVRATSADEPSSIVKITGGSSAHAATSTPTITGTADVPTGSTVDVEVGTQELSTAVTPSGTWSVTPPQPLQEGAVTVTATTATPSTDGSAAPAPATDTQKLTVDTVAPQVTVAGGEAVAAATATPRLAGTTDAPDGSVVTVGVDDQVLRTTVAAGAWAVTPAPLPDGPQAVSVTVKDLAGNTTRITQTLTVTATGLSIDGGPSALVGTTTPVISGRSNGLAGRPVTVSVAGQTLTGTVAAGGRWSVAPAALPQGGHLVTARATTAGGVRASATQGLSVDTVAPAIVVDGGAARSTRTSSATLSGRVGLPEGSRVRVEVDGDARFLQLSADRTWSRPIAGLGVGAHEVLVSATDPAGNVGSRRQRLVVVPGMAIDGTSARLTRDTTPTVSGTSDAPAGTRVTVTVGTQVLTAQVTSAGTWSVTPERLGSTVHHVVAVVRDAWGYTRSARQTLTVDTIAPSIVVNGGGVTGTRATTPVVSGRVNVPTGSTVTVTVDGVRHDVVVSPARTWSVTSQRLAVGTHTVVVTATDAAGNVGTQRQRLIVKA